MIVALNLIGKLSITRDGQPVDLRSRKAQALLIYLALTGKPQTREHLATLLWGDRFDDQARSSLRQVLYALRKAVGHGIVVGDENISLAEDSLTIVDEDDKSHETDFREILPNFLIGEDEFDDWLTGVREQRRSSKTGDMYITANNAKSGGKDDLALELAQRCLEFDPLHEDALCLAMRLLADKNRRTEALSLYQTFSKKLSRELDATPRDGTQKLARRIRESFGDDPVEPIASEGPSRTSGQLAHVLLTPFEDLGGGEMATFFASEMPSELAIKMRVRDIVAIQTILGTQATASNAIDYLSEANNRGALTIVSGSARQVGSQVRITANILSVVENRIVWNGREIVEQSDAFAAIGEFADQVTGALARTVAELYDPENDKRPIEEVLDDPRRFETVLKNRVWRTFVLGQNRQNMVEETRFLERALERYPKSIEVITWNAFVVFHAAHLGDRKDRLDRYREAQRWIDRALAIDQVYPLALSGRIIISTWLGKFDESIGAYEKMVSLDMANASIHGLIAGTYTFMGRNEEAINNHNNAIEYLRGTKMLFSRFALRGLTEFNQQDFEAALRSARSSLDISREFFLGHLVKIAALEKLGRHTQATTAVDEMNFDYHKPSISEFAWLPFVADSSRRSFFRALRDAGLPE